MEEYIYIYIHFLKTNANNFTVLSSFNSFEGGGGIIQMLAPTKKNVMYILLIHGFILLYLPRI